MKETDHLEEREVYDRMGWELNVFIEIYSPQGPTIVGMESGALEVTDLPSAWE
jgi:hypothetical protein